MMNRRSRFIEVIIKKKISFAFLTILVIFIVFLLIYFIKTSMRYNEIGKIANSYTSVYKTIESNIGLEKPFILNMNDFEKSNFRIVMKMTSRDNFKGRCVLLQGFVDEKEIMSSSFNFDKYKVIIDENHEFNYEKTDDKKELFGNTHFFSPNEINSPVTLVFIVSENPASVNIEIEQVKTSWNTLEVLFNERSDLITRQILLIFLLSVCFLPAVVLIFVITK